MTYKLKRKAIPLLLSMLLSFSSLTEVQITMNPEALGEKQS